MKRLPKFLKKYFWDVKFENIDLRKRRIYVLRRIMDYGDGEAISWMWKNFTELEIKNILRNYRDLSLKSANFWAVIVNVKKEDVKCLKKSFRETRKQFWPY
ncbi:MAG: hypothetical protein ABH952_06245 [Candidatus Omnitrophota bacterium]